MEMKRQKMDIFIVFSRARPALRLGASFLVRRKSARDLAAPQNWSNRARLRVCLWRRASWMERRVR